MRRPAISWNPACALALLSHLLAAALSLAGEAGVPYFINFDPKAYDPTIGFQNWAVVEDQRGLIYVGNTSGVVEYDGVSWRRIPLPGRSTARSLASDGRGRIFVGGQGTFGVLEADPLGQLRYRGLSDQLPAAAVGFADVWKTHVTNDGVFFQAFDALFRWHGNTLQTIQPRNRFHMSFAVRGALFVRDEGIGLLRYRNGTLAPLPGGEFFADMRVYTMLPWSSDAILVGTREAGLFVLDNDGVRRFASAADQILAAGQLYDGALLADGSVALATLRAGVVVIDPFGNLLALVNREVGLQDSTVTSLSTDRRGGLWLTLDRNLSRIQIPASFTLFGEVTGLVGGVTDITRHDGVLFATTTQGVYRLTPRQASSSTANPLSDFVLVPGIATQCWDFCAVMGRLLAATNDGVYEVRPGGARPVAPLRSLTLLASRFHRGVVYSGGLDGVHRLEFAAGSWQRPTLVGMAADEVRSLAEADDGSLWAGGRYHGLHRLTPDGAPGEPWRAQVFTEDEGLPPDHLRTQVFRGDDTVLAATRSGLYRFDAAAGTFVPADDLGAPFGSPGCWVTAVRNGADGDLWIVSGPDTGVGVSRRRDDGERRWLSSAFRGIPASGVLEVFPEADGTVWLGTSNGLIRYDPSVPRPAPRQLRCLVRKVTTLRNERPIFYGSRSRSSAAPAEPLPFASNGLRFEYSAPLPEAQESVEYRSRLEGFDRSWSEWNREVRREYTNLPEGRYRFQVMARAAGRVLSDTAAFELQILPPWHRTWWATSAFLMVAVALLWAFVQLQVRHARRKERTESENRRRAYELQRARSIQRNMLPTAPPRIPGLEIVAEQRTATEVGGDYYDFFPQKDGSFYLAVGDATGHGLGAGLMVAATRTALLTVRERDLVRVVERLNQVLRKVHLGHRLNMALTLVRLDPGSGSPMTAQASGGGMAPLYVLRVDGRAEEHPICGIPLGAMEHPEYALHEFQLHRGDALILMSDGVHERHHPERGLLGFHGVLRCLEELGPAAPGRDGHEAGHILRHLLESGDEWADFAPVGDDVTVVVVKLI